MWYGSARFSYTGRREYSVAIGLAGLGFSVGWVVVVKGLIDTGQVRDLLADYNKMLRGEIEMPALGDRRVKGRWCSSAIRRGTCRTGVCSLSAKSCRQPITTA